VLLFRTWLAFHTLRTSTGCRYARDRAE
jgi:hypothetical protein